MKLNTDMMVHRISDQIWEIPTTEKDGMRVPARLYATESILSDMDRGVFEQITNVACLPGIRRYALCMPDGHWGYGFPIGGVAAFDPREGIISPGGVGYDVNCGMRLIRTDLTLSDVRPRLESLMTELFRKVPAGVGARGLGISNLLKDLDKHGLLVIPARPSEPPREPNYLASLYSPVGRAVLGGLAAFGLQAMQTTDANKSSASGMGSRR